VTGVPDGAAVGAFVSEGAAVVTGRSDAVLGALGGVLPRFASPAGGPGACFGAGRGEALRGGSSLELAVTDRLLRGMDRASRIIAASSPPVHPLAV
jgi:hypothetical protein